MIQWRVISLKFKWVVGYHIHANTFTLRELILGGRQVQKGLVSDQGDVRASGDGLEWVVWLAFSECPRYANMKMKIW